jgi:hypothetical protein
MTVLNYNVFHNTYEELIKIDSLIIPNSLKTIVNNLKALETELFKTNNIKFRNSIIEFAEKMKVAMNFRANNKCGSGRRVPWPAGIKSLSFNDMADMFYFLSYPASQYNKILTAAVNINRSLKLQMQYADNNRFYCPRYKLEDKNGNFVPFFNQIITRPGHRQAVVVKNNVVRMLLGGQEGFMNSNYNVKYQPGCRWWGLLPLPQDACGISEP